MSRSTCQHCDKSPQGSLARGLLPHLGGPHHTPGPVSLAHMEATCPQKPFLVSKEPWVRVGIGGEILCLSSSYPSEMC